MSDEERKDALERIDKYMTESNSLIRQGEVEGVRWAFVHMAKRVEELNRDDFHKYAELLHLRGKYREASAEIERLNELAGDNEKINSSLTDKLVESDMNLAQLRDQLDAEVSHSKKVIEMNNLLADQLNAARKTIRQLRRGRR